MRISSPSAPPCFGAGLGQLRDERLQHVEAPPAVLRGDGGDGLEAEAMELGEPIGMLRPVDLVDRQGHGLVAAPQGAGDGLVLGQQARLAVDHEQDGVGLRDGGLGLGLYGGLEAHVGMGLQAGRVHQQEPTSLELDLLGDAVPGDPRAVVDEGAPLARHSG